MDITLKEGQTIFAVHSGNDLSIHTEGDTLKATVSYLLWCEPVCYHKQTIKHHLVVGLVPYADPKVSRRFMGPKRVPLWHCLLSGVLEGH